jgi:hypothetical protein
MAIAVVIDMDGVTAEQHDALIKAMGLDGQPASAVPGLIFHAAGPTSTGWRVIDIWESEADVERFQREQLMPAAEHIGGLPRPRVEMMPLHRLQR